MRMGKLGKMSSEKQGAVFGKSKVVIFDLRQIDALFIPAIMVRM